MIRLIILRHGQTDWNIQRRIMGKMDIPLSDAGRKEAELLAGRLEKEQIDVFYTSPLTRALETVDIVAQRHGKNVEILDDLIEMDFGETEGKTKEERTQQYPWFDVTNDTHREKLGMDTFVETIQHLETAIIPLLIKKHNNQTIVLATHDMKMRALLVALGMPESVKAEKMKNTGITIVEKRGKFLTIISHNDNSHIKEHV